MKAFIIFLLLVGAAAVPWYLSRRPPDFGVAARHPLGDFKKMDAWLLDQDYQKEELDLGPRSRSSMTAAASSAVWAQDSTPAPGT